MFSFIRGLILIGILFYIALIYHSPSIALLSIIMCVFWIAAFLWLLFWRSRMGFLITIPIAIAEQGSPTEVQVRVENRSRITCWKLKFRLDVRNRLNSKLHQKWLAAGSALPGKSRYAYRLFLEGAGCYQVRLGKVRIYDLTGLFYMEWKTRYTAAVSVMPEIADVPLRLTDAVRNFFGDSDIYDEKRPGHDSSETFVIRPFRDGDKIQSIHWKLSAKTDEWMVRERSLPKACPVVLFLEYRQRKREQNSELFLQIAGSLSFSLMDAGCPHYVCWFSSEEKTIVRLRVDDEESFYLFLAWCLEDIQGLIDCNLKELYRERYPGERYVHELRLEESTAFFRNGEMLVRFHPDRWKDELGSMELIL